MPQAIRATIDFSVGHCWPPAPCVTGSTTVFINNLPSVRQGDIYPTHPGSCGDNPPHFMGPALTGSPTVFVNNKPLHRAGDLITCGDIAFNGSPNVIVN